MSTFDPDLVDDDFEYEHLPEADDPSDVDWATAAEPAAPADGPLLDAADAAEALRASIKKARDEETARNALIPAPEPVPLHQVTFPIYDRAARGYRLINRAVGTRELVTLVKLGLDAISGVTGAGLARSLDLNVPAPTSLSNWKPSDLGICHFGNEHARHWRYVSFDPSGATNLPLPQPGNLTEVGSALSNMMQCIYDNVPTKRLRDSTPFDDLHSVSNDGPVLQGHAPFLTWSAKKGMWDMHFPPEMWAPLN